MISPAFAARIIADDLTGALDAAAPLAARFGAFDVSWGERSAPLTGAAAFDTETRDLDPQRAIRRTAAAAVQWWRGFDGLAFKKVDSVWRGHAAAEIAAAMDAGGFDRAVVAPAFPAQGRITRDGAQWVVSGTGTQCVASDLAADLRAAGLAAAREHASDASARVQVCDADDQAVLEAIVMRHMGVGRRLLWCGSAGLAHALARALPGRIGPPELCSVEPAIGDGPVLVLVGTDHPATQAQAAVLAAVPGVFEHWIDLDRPDGDHPPSFAATHEAPILLIRFAVRSDTARANVAALIRRALLHEAPRMPRPRLAIATGGETLCALGDALGATRLTVAGECCTGVPSGAWLDGRWAGIPQLSKSGGFGAPDLLASLVLKIVHPVAATHALVRNH